MPLKPIQPSAILRQLSPRSFGKSSSSFFAGNRFSHLRDESPGRPPNGRQVRDRSASLKRKLDTEFSYADAVGKSATPSVSPVLCKDDIDTVSVNVATVSSLCDKVCKDINDAVCDPAIISILSEMCDAIKTVNSSVDLIKGRLGCNSAPSAAPPKKQRQLASLAPLSQIPIIVTDKPSNDEPPSVTRFKDAVKEAEKATLVFNLNMGKVPIINKETMSKNATLSLLALAAKKEGKDGTTPSDEAICAIDDVLSVAEGIEFFGKSTKSFRSKDSSNSGAYCTIPVKYEFKDKDTRIRVEQTLREVCKIQCTTPYPPILRECIKKTLDHFKVEYPDDFIRVYVDSASMSLRVARRPKDSAEWVYYKKDIGLPNDVLNVTSRTIPANLELSNLPDHSVDAGTPSKPVARGRQPKKSNTIVDTHDSMELSSSAQK